MATDGAPIRAPREGESSLRRLGLLLRPYALVLVGTVLMLIGLAAVNMALPAFLKVLIDDVFPNGDWRLLIWLLAGILVVYILRNLLFFGSKYSSVHVGEDVCFSLRNRLFDRLQRMSMSYYRRNNPGKLSSRVMNDSFVIQQFIQDEVPNLLLATFLFIGLVAVIYAINWQLALASTIVLPLHLLTYHYFKRPIKQASGVAQEQLAVVHGNLIEKILGVEVVKSFTGERRENESFQQAIDRSRRSERRSKTFHVLQKNVADMLVGLGTIALFAFGAYQVMKPTDPMKPGTFLVFFSYVLKLYPTVLELMSGFAKLAKSTASIDRVFDMLDTELNEPEQQKVADESMVGDIAFEGVTFRYDDGEPVLRNVNFSVKGGQVCTIIGPSGSGKSTLVSLVPRFNEPSIGRVTIDGRDLRQYNLRQLRRMVGIAFQECFLFNSSILENLRYAKPNASMKEIVQVAKITGAHDFIERMPEGYETVLGEAGISLSRGEKQRITLTRAMLKNPQILILDEATASIDAAGAAKIIPAILEFMKGKTTLMITHRPDLLRHADVVVSLVDGRITYQGPVTEEMATALATGQAHRPSTTQQASQGSKLGGSLNVLLAGALLTLSTLLAGTVALADAAAPAQNPPQATPASADKPGPDEAAESDETAQGEGRFIAMPGLNEVEAQDAMDVIVAQTIARLQYRQTGEGEHIDAAPAAVGANLVTLVRDATDGKRYIQIGYRTFRSQPIHMWLYGQTNTQQATLPNADLPTVEKLLEEANKSLDERRKTLTLSDLRTELITLSYIEPSRCLAVLKSLGYQTIEYKSAGTSPGGDTIIDPIQNADPKRLPIVMSLPGSDATQLVGGTGTQRGAFGLQTAPSVASEIKSHTAAGTMMQLMVLYDPAKPEQYGELLQRIRRHIDTSAKQILIEAMVLEISETGLERLGVKWELKSTNSGVLQFLNMGTLPFAEADSSEGTFTAKALNIFGEFDVTIQALLENGEAKVLSRPSVLTLNNRQASIRVGEDVPVATSYSGRNTGDNLSFNFQYIPIGILLNVRPRMNAELNQVSMQIDAVVSDEVPNQQLELTDREGEVVASAPRISMRRVQTYTRIQNNTPFIIGGLVSKNNIRRTDKVPLLGDLPLLGHAFRNVNNTELRREVIIVITPYILPEDPLVGRFLPKDEDMFDSFGNQLFRDAYRIRTEDVFDLSFLKENRQLKQASRVANAAIVRNRDLAELYPFSEFQGERIPGEQILVYRQMYEVVKRLEIDERVDIRKMIFFVPDTSSASGFKVQFLWPYLSQIAGMSGELPRDAADALFARMRGKALAITFTRDEDRGTEEVLKGPVPRTYLVDCNNRQDWSRLLWQLNQPDEYGNSRSTILIHSPRDLTRLRRAAVLKRTVELNANRKSLTLGNFSVGRLLLMPEVKPETVHLIDNDTAEYFFYTEQYYPALQRALNRSIRSLEAAMDDPRVRRAIGAPEGTP